MEAPKTFKDLGFKFNEVEKWYKIEDILKEEIMVQDFILVNGGYSVYALITFNWRHDGMLYGVSTGAKVIIEKLQQAREQHLLPLAGTIIHEKRWYDLV